MNLAIFDIDGTLTQTDHVDDICFLQALADAHQITASFADDAPSREDILRSAIAKAKKRYQQTSFARIVSIGDGLWDVRTARNLQFPFLGIGSGAREQRLLQAGATHVLVHFADYRKLMRCLEEAEIPAPN